ncbi:MFS transporter [Patescibacteria group bacterium]|nr:MFS transporter [Patescibacteria group bacterium]
MFNIGKLFRFPEKTTDRNQNLYNNNIFYLRILSVFRSLFFMVPVWVSMELKYITLTQVAIIDMVILFSAIILELPTGALADLIGRKKSVSISFFVSAMAYFLFAYADSFSLFLIAGLGFGLGDALMSGALEALVFDTLKQNKKEAAFSEISNKNNLIFNYSIFAAIIIGGLIFEKHYHLPSVLTGISFLIATFISLKFIEPDIDSEKFTLKNYLLQTKMGFKELFKNKQSRDISLFYILVGAFTWPIVLSFKNFALVDLGVSEKNMGFILAFLSLFAVQFLHVLIRKKVFEKMKVVFLMPAILLSIFLPLSYFYQVPSMVVIIFVVFIVSSMRWNVLGKLSNQCYSSKNRATAISSLSMMISLAFILILAIFSVLNEYTEQALRIIFLIMGLGSIFLLLPISIKLAKKYHNKVLEIYD